ncbi:UNVERIFIED_CONTAM: hypothetical protein GTU68_043718 [Idotea baltica]|nr:hypothetical protein [Idotea baltica]
MISIVLFGPPGSGKGTQAKILAEKFDLKHISTGDLLRAEKAAETELGLEAKKYMDAGELVPDAVVIGMIATMLEGEASKIKGVIFDGFPRTVAQAEALDNLLGSIKAPILKVLSLDVTDDEIVNRLLERGKESGRVDDQNEDTIRNRLEVYNNSTAPVAGFYNEQCKLQHIPGEGDIQAINNALSHELEGLAV